MSTTTINAQTTALWLGDLHLDQTGRQQRERVFEQIQATESECVIITGDIASSRHLQEQLRRMALICAPRPVYFVLGNHDYYGSDIGSVERELTTICRSTKNLYHLTDGSIVPLTSGVCLTGIRGWADARAGYGLDTVIDTPDRHSIGDFQGLNKKQTLQKMQDLGKVSARTIRKTLPLALTQYQQVVIVTHVPPFPTSVRYDDAPCGPAHLPHFANLSAGLAILGITKAFPRRRVTVIAGHSHAGYAETILPNLKIRVGEARTGNPGIFDVIRF